MSDKIKSISPLGFPWDTQDPFLFCVYHMDNYPAGNGQLGVKPEELRGRNMGQDFNPQNAWRMYHGRAIPGFPYHPHRGFETITINKQGAVDHSDSLGAAGRFMEGDVQWMTAGKGVQHSEMFPLLHNDKPNTLEIFQIWLNLPKVSKFVEPHFKMLWKEDIPVKEFVNNDGKKAIVDIVAGELAGIKSLDPTPDSWAADPKNGIRVLTVKMEPGSQWSINETAAGVNRSIYFYQGDEIKIDGFKVEETHQIQLHASANVEIKNESETPAYLLVLEGRPIGEPVAQYGPFVMNTQEEIRQAISDYQRTEFGGWPWKEREQVHGSNKGRFALHSDGREEGKG